MAVREWDEEGGEGRYGGLRCCIAVILETETVIPLHTFLLWPGKEGRKEEEGEREMGRKDKRKGRWGGVRRRKWERWWSG